MAHEVRMPKLGLTMTEGSVSHWSAKPGDVVRAGEVLLVVETDKVAFDVEAEVGGVLLDIAVVEGETVPVGTPLARIGGSNESGTRAPSAAAPTSSPSRAAPSAAGPPASTRNDGRIIATPLARKLAAAAGVDLATVTGSGPRSRIKAADVEHATSQRPHAIASSARPSVVDGLAAAAPAATGGPVMQPAGDAVVPAAPARAQPAATIAPGASTRRGIAGRSADGLARDVRPDEGAVVTRNHRALRPVRSVASSR